MLGLFIFSLALHFLASPAVRNQVKPVEKEAEVASPEAGYTVQWHWSDAKFSCYRKKALRSRVLRACGNVLDVVLLRQMLINKYTCTDSEIKKTLESVLTWRYHMDQRGLVRGWKKEVSAVVPGHCQAFSNNQET